MSDRAHDWQPLALPEQPPADVPQHQCARCGLCRTFPNPSDRKEVAYWFLPPYNGAASSKPTDEPPPCHP